MYNVWRRSIQVMNTLKSRIRQGTLASAGSGVMPGSEESDMRIGQHGLGCFVGVGGGDAQPMLYICGLTALKASVCLASSSRVASRFGPSG